MVRHVFGAMLLTAALVAPAWAQADIQGRVKFVDPATNTVHFTDGRIAYIEPGSTITLDGQRVTFADIQPEMNVVVRAGARAAQPTMMPDHPPVDASGVVARVDKASSVIVFEDGRTLKTSDGRIWQSVKTDDVEAGDVVFLNDAQPVAVPTPMTSQSSQQLPQLTADQARMGQQQRMGTISRVDATRKTVVLSDGTVVRLKPAGKVLMGTQVIDLSQMKPGDEVVILLTPAPAMASDASRTTAREYSGSASPRMDPFPIARSIEGDEIRIMRRQQAP